MPVFLFYGEDTYSHRTKLKLWQSEFAKKYDGDLNITILNGESSVQDILSASTSMPFLSEKRLTIVKNFLSEAKAEEQSALAEQLETIPDFCILVFSETGEIDKRTSLYKKLAKTATLNEFPLIRGAKLLSWIEKEVTRQGGTIDKSATLLLTEVIDGDLYRLENEIGKLVAYAAGRSITKEDIELMVQAQLTTSIFKLTDGVGQKNYKLALSTLNQLNESGEDLHRVFYMIMRQFRIITCVKDLIDQGARRDEIVAKLKEHPFVISNTMMQAKNFSLAQLKKAYKLLIDVDTKLKSGGIKIVAGDNREFSLALDRLVLELCR